MILLPVSFAVWWFSPTVAYSVLLGGVIQVLPNTYFALYAFRYQGAQRASFALRAMSRGETGKFVLTLTGFALTFSLFKSVNVIALFVSYIVMVIVSVVMASKVIAPNKMKNK